MRFRKVRLKGELAADAYVRSKGEEIYESHLSGIEKLYKLGGMDRDVCKRMNLGHLDLDERRDLMARGGTGLPKRSVKRGIGSFAAWLVLGLVIGVLIQYVPVTPSARWRSAHSDFHDLMYTDSGDEAIETIRRAVAIAEKNFGAGSKKLSTSLTDLTEALIYYDNYDEAREVGTRAVEVAGRVYGEGDLMVVRSLKNMGEVHYWSEEYGPAREWFSRALDLQNRQKDDDADIDTWDEKLQKVRRRIDRLGPINLAAIDEFKEQSERKEYLDSQLADLNEALDTLEGAIRKIDRETRTRFRETYDNVNDGFQRLFPKLFGGGHAYLELTGEDLLSTGITVMARPPGKRNSTIHLLSGGEKALTAVALVFAIFELNPAPFCMLDEVDAPLDDANVSRFCDIVREMSDKVQFVFITHNKVTMELARQLSGVTMQEPGVSRLVSVDLDAAVKMAAS